MIQKSSIEKCMAFFCDYPSNDHTLKDISLGIDLAHTSVKKAVMDLKKQDLVKVKTEKKGARIFPLYSANFNNMNFKKYKTLFNLRKLLDSGLINFLSDLIMPRAIVLFGSYLKGEDTEESDIDIFIESKEEKLNLSKFEKILKRKIQIHFKQDFNDYPRELKNNILNGYVLYGFLEGFK